jgi:molybdopterin-guanine dinucleotide biosynthesis protein A
MAASHSQPAYPRDSITGLVLAGGRGSRMGGEDKGLITIAGRPMVAYVLDILRPQVGTLLLSANRNRERYAAYGFPVLADTVDGYLGPLAGVFTALQKCTTEFLVTVPCDAPLLAPDLVARLYAACTQAGTDIAVASDGAFPQPVFLLARPSLATSLESYLAGGGRKAHAWLGQLRAAEADFSDQPDTFVNINDPAERERIEARLLSSRTSR